MCWGQPFFTNSNTLDNTGSTCVAWLISLCVIGKQSTSRSSILKTVLSPPAVNDKGRRDNASATAFCLDGTNLMLLLRAARIIAQRCKRIAASDGIAVLGPKIRSSGLWSARIVKCRPYRYKWNRFKPNMIARASLPITLFMFVQCSRCIGNRTACPIWIHVHNDRA